MRYDYNMAQDADYIEYFTAGLNGFSPSACVWMVPGTELED